MQRKSFGKLNSSGDIQFSLKFLQKNSWFFIQRTFVLGHQGAPIITTDSTDCRIVFSEINSSS